MTRTLIILWTDAERVGFYANGKRRLQDDSFLDELVREGLCDADATLERMRAYLQDVGFRRDALKWSWDDFNIWIEDFIVVFYRKGIFSSVQLLDEIDVEARRKLTDTTK